MKKIVHVLSPTTGDSSFILLHSIVSPARSRCTIWLRSKSGSRHKRRSPSAIPARSGRHCCLSGQAATSPPVWLASTMSSHCCKTASRRDLAQSGNRLSGSYHVGLHRAIRSRSSARAIASSCRGRERIGASTAKATCVASSSRCRPALPSVAEALTPTVWTDARDPCAERPHERKMQSPCWLF